MFDITNKCTCDWILVKSKSYTSGYMKKWILCDYCEGLTKYFQSLDDHKFMNIMDYGEITFNRKSNWIWLAELDRRRKKAEIIDVQYGRKP